MARKKPVQKTPTHDQQLTLASQATQPTMADPVVTIVLRRRNPGMQRTIDKSKVQADADKQSYTASKFLLDRKAYRDAITSFMNEVYTEVRSRTLPFSGLKDGCYMIRLSGVPEFREFFRVKQAQLRERVEGFLEEYPKLKEQARLQLRSLFDESDYPSPEVLRAQIGIEYRVESVSIPEALRGLDPELYEEQKKQLEADNAAAMAEARNTLRTYLLELVKHAADRLSPNEDGSRKVFRDSLVANIEEFLTFFPQRNVADDAPLATEVEKLRKLMKGVEPGMLRDNETLSASIAAEFKKMEESIDGMLVDAGQRKITLRKQSAA